MNRQMKLLDDKDPANVSIRKREWQTMSSYRGGHALFRIIDKSAEFGEFIVSGSVDPEFRDVDEIWVNITEYLVDDFGNDLSWYGEIRFWQPYPEKLKGVEK